MYKKQIAELHSKYNEETKRADKCEFDYKKANEQLKAVTREKEVRNHVKCLVIFFCSF